ncbi:DEKNAAC101143 [Brettanomyces naardenensis]|uniref:Post-GPI attachment to proteins factor 3 n=1 Tax=Brettanomyces naardenensis TaxID=13370 RepID=A0A448YH97_BRENA|nr:DEKNAAC101143 [Brettanomyces naardenensis]
MQQRLLYVVFSALLCLQLPTVRASTGDELEEFEDCVKLCDIVTCNGRDKYDDVSDASYTLMVNDQAETNRFVTMPLAWNLRLLGWECYPNCDYQCQRLVTAERSASGKEVVQFHGKWPFLRALGVQELFSTLFSIANFFPHYWGFLSMWNHYENELQIHGNPEAANLYWAYMVVGIVASMAWVFSTLFHLRDTWTREQLDYFFAGMTVISGLYGVGVRYFRLYLTKNNRKRLIFAALIIFMYLGHVTRLLIDWSYTYNMQADVAIGLIQDVLWISHSISTFNKRRVSKDILEDLTNPDVNWTLTPIALVISVSLGMTFELFDFPPMLELLDAHALWHFCTIWPALYWYPYMVRDVEEGVKDKKYE